MQNKLSSQPLLEIHLLGRFEAKIDGVPVDEKRWVRRSAKSLVKLLALKPCHALHREQIMDLLWTELPPEIALNNLNKAIYKARRTLEPNLVKGARSQFILTQNKQIILNSPGTLCVDLDEFERLADCALRNNNFEAGQKALELYRGDLLTEDIYEDWIYTRRESMRILFRKTATKTAEIHAAKGEHPASIEILKKLIAEDATDEHIHRLLMRFYGETGSKYQALKQFEQCRAALRSLGIEPEPETVTLDQKIKSGEILPVKNELKSANVGSAAKIISSPRITPLTFQNGIVKSANFPPDGETIVLSAAWNDGDAELYTMILKTGEIYRIGIKNVYVYSISSAGKMAVALNPKSLNAYNNTATLAKLPLSGRVPCELLKDVQWADWHPVKNDESTLSDKKFLAVVRDGNGKNCLEYPIGNAIYETGGWISRPRFSADGKKIAFIEHPLTKDDGGFIVFINLEDKSKEKQILTDYRVTIQGLAWFKDEIWFTGAREGIVRKINAVDLKGAERSIYSGIGNLTLHDISEKTGKALVTDNKIRFHIAARRASENFERDLSWHDWTLPRDLTDDGETLLFEEAGISGGNYFSAYIKKTDGSSARKIGSGSPLALSPDGKYALVRINKLFNRLVLMPIGEGDMKPFETNHLDSLTYQEFACFFPDGKRIMFAANDSKCGRRIYTQNIDGGIPICITPDEEGVEMFSPRSISPNGKYVVLNNSKNRISLYQTDGGASMPLKHLEEDFYLIRWAGDGENLFIRRYGEVPTIVYKYNPANGTKEKWLELMPQDTTGVNRIQRILLTPDGKTYVYCFIRESSDLYLMEGFE